MEHYEMAEKLAEKAGVSLEAAKEALETADWDMLDAMILLEKQGKTESRTGTYETAAQKDEKEEKQETARGGKVKREAFCENAKAAGKRVVRFCCDNKLSVYGKDGDRLITCPVVIPIVLLAAFSVVTLAAIVLMLIFGMRFRFEGPELGKQKINDFMDKAGEAAEKVRNSFDDEGGEDK